MRSLKGVLYNFFGQFIGLPVKIQRKTWEKEYRVGYWDRLRSKSELVRYLKISEFVKRGNYNSILDVGCGEGLLLERIKGFYIKEYMGIDISTSAISVAKERHKHFKTFNWKVSSAEEFLNWNSFELIIFNESLYYISDYINLLKHILKINPTVNLLISLHNCRRTRKMVKILKIHFPRITTERISSSSLKWIFLTLTKQN